MLNDVSDHLTNLPVMFKVDLAMLRARINSVLRFWTGSGNRTSAAIKSVTARMPGRFLKRMSAPNA